MKPCPKLLAGLTRRSSGAARNTSYCTCLVPGVLRQYELDRRYHLPDNVSSSGQPSAAAVPLPSQCLRSSVVSSKRPFSTTTCTRASLDDSEDFDDAEEGDLFGDDSGDTSRQLDNLIRGRRGGKVKTKAVSIKDALRAKERESREREAREKRTRQLLNPRFFERAQRVNSKFSSVVSTICELESEIHNLKHSIPRAKAIDGIGVKVLSLPSVDELRSEYYILKYSGFDAEIAQLAEAYRSLSDEYMLLKYRRFERVVSRLCASIRASKRGIWILRRTILWRKVHLWIEATSNIVHELDIEFTRPRVSARRKINRLLDLDIKIQQDYTELKKKTDNVYMGLSGLGKIILDMSIMDGMPPLRAGHYRKRHAEIVDMTLDFEAAAHSFRTFFRLRSTYERPVSGALGLDSFKGYLMRRSPYRRIAASIMNNLAFSRKADIGPDPVALVSKDFRGFYMQNSREAQSSRSSELDIRWRQLDVIAPFELVLANARQLRAEIRYLASTLRPHYPMWTRLSDRALLIHRDRLRRWILELGDIYSSFSAEYSLYLSINWLRLELEDKLDTLGVPDRAREQGLFRVPQPLSQDLTRFHEWADKMGASFIETWMCVSAIQKQAAFWIKADEKRSSLTEERIRKLLLPGSPNILNLGSTTIYHEPEKSVRRLRAKYRRTKLSGINKSRKIKRGTKSTLPVTSSSHKGPSGFSARHTLRRRVLRIERKDTSREVEETRKSSKAPLAPKYGNDESTRKHFDYTTSKTPGSTKLSAKLQDSRRSKTASSGLNRSIASNQTPSSGSKKFNTIPTYNSRTSQKPYSTYLPRRSINCLTDSDSLDNLSSKSPETISVDACDRMNSFEHFELGVPMQQPFRGPSTSADQAQPTRFWGPNVRGPDCKHAVIHYCQTLESAETVAQYFLKNETIGFDIEWKPQASVRDSIQDNVSLIQIANEERIAIFHLALFRPARTVDDLVPPSLRRFLESPRIMKVGVCIKADSTRLRKYLNIDAHGLFELSHLYKLVKYRQSKPELIDKRPVRLSLQAEEYLGAPLYKGDDLRCSDWTSALSHQQIQYAAADPYACLSLFNIMDSKRKSMAPTPPRPAYAELNLPIRLDPNVTTGVQL